MAESHQQMMKDMAEETTLLETARGGYGGGGGGGGYGGGGGGYGGYGMSDYVDPYVVLASLGFGVFLFNLLFNILNRTGRSVDVMDGDLPLELSDRPEVIARLESVITSGGVVVSSQQQPTTYWEDWSSSSRLNQLVKHSWLVADSIRRNPAVCAKTLLCQLASSRNDPIAWMDSNSLAHQPVQLYVEWLARHYGVEDNLARFVDLMEAGRNSSSDDFCGGGPAAGIPAGDGCGKDNLMSLM